MGDRLAAMDGKRLTSNALCEECCWAQQLQCIAALPNTDLDLCRSPTPSGRAPSDFATLPTPVELAEAHLQRFSRNLSSIRVCGVQPNSRRQADLETELVENVLSDWYWV